MHDVFLWCSWLMARSRLNLLVMKNSGTTTSIYASGHSIMGVV